MTESYTEAVVNIGEITGYGAKLKAIVNKFIEMGAFTLLSTVTDTADSYTCWLRPAGVSSTGLKVKVYTENGSVGYIKPFTNNEAIYANDRSLAHLSFDSSILKFWVTGPLKSVQCVATSGSATYSQSRKNWMTGEKFISGDAISVFDGYNSEFASSSYSLSDVAISPYFGGASMADVGAITSGDAVCVPQAMVNAGTMKGVNGDYFYKASVHPTNTYTKFYVGDTLMFHISDGNCFKCN